MWPRWAGYSRKVTAESTVTSLKASMQVSQCIFRLAKQLRYAAALLVVYAHRYPHCRLSVDLSQKNILRLVGGTTLYNGAVEWKQHAGSNQRWISFAYISWSDANSAVACRHLGFNNFTGQHYRLSRPHSATACVSRLTCSGSEKTLDECPGLGLQQQCDVEELVGIHCTDPLEMFTLATPTTQAPPSSGVCIIMYMSLSILLEYTVYVV